MTAWSTLLSTTSNAVDVVTVFVYASLAITVVSALHYGLQVIKLGH